jgi:mannose-6-phosphate isomerase-like protein (cupin superfamily)
VKVIPLAAAAAAIPETWSPRVAGEVNGHQVKVARVHGEFPWHAHAAEDEAFLVLRGRLRIRLRDREDLVLGEGEFVVIPRGVEHAPEAAEETLLALFEPASTVNTGELRNERTRAAIPLEPPPTGA